MFGKVISLFDNLNKQQLITLAIVSIILIILLGFYLYKCRKNWSLGSDSNRRPADYKSAALATAPPRPVLIVYTT